MAYKIAMPFFVTAMLLSGCATQQHVQDQAFRDYLNFHDICVKERGLKEDYCQQMWRSFMDAQAKFPAKQEVTYNSTNVQYVSAPVNPELMPAMQLNAALLTQEIQMGQEVRASDAQDINAVALAPAECGAP